MNLFKALYIVAIGILIAAFVGFGVETFYPSPKAPEYPSNLDYSQDGALTKEARDQQQTYERNQKSWVNEQNSHNQTSAVILIITAAILLAASLLLLSKVPLLGDAVTLGGVLTLFYGLLRAVSTQEAVFRFIAVGVALVLIVGLTYWRFLRKAK